MRPTSGFTLVELMISLAMMLILMLGIAKVFRVASGTTAASHQMLRTMRDGRSAQSVLRQDFSSAVADGAACMILRSMAQPAFRNRADELGDRDYSPTDTPTEARKHSLTIDLDGDNREGAGPGETISPVTCNARNHRADILSFFSRQRASRQTGGVGSNGPIVAQQTADEQWIWYGHLWLPGPNPADRWPLPKSASPSVTFPGQGNFATNPNNFHASQWMLGRVAILLAQPRTAPDLGIYDRASPPARQRYFCIDPATDGNCPLAPLQAGAFDCDGKAAPARASGTATLEQSRYDLAGTSIDTFREQLRAWLAQNPDGNWWDRMMCADVISFGKPAQLTGGRFQASAPASPITAESSARQTPIFLTGCTQFIVEFAGDFLSQDRFGRVTAAEPDGVIDYWQDLTSVPAASTFAERGTWKLGIDYAVNDFVEYTGQNYWCVTAHSSTESTTPASSNMWKPYAPIRQTRWYGLPRNTFDGNDTSTGPVIGNTASAVGSNGPNEAKFRDVMPLRDVLQAAGLVSPAHFERLLPTNGGANDYTITMKSTDEYVCAWDPGDPKPRLIRMVITLDDPSGALAEGQTFEYVFNLP